MKNPSIQNIIDFPNHKIIGLINPSILLALLTALREHDKEGVLISIESLIFDEKIVIHSIQGKHALECEVNNHHGFLEKNKNVSSYDASENGYKFIFNGMPEELLDFIQEDLHILDSDKVSILNYEHAAEIFFNLIKRNTWLTAASVGVFILSLFILFVYEAFKLGNFKELSLVHLNHVEMTFLVLITASIIFMYLFRKRRIDMFLNKKGKLQFLKRLLAYSVVIGIFILCFYTA